MNARADDFHDALRATIEQAVEKTLSPALVAAGLVSEPRPCLPPPSDTDAERAVVGAVVSGEISLAELGELRPKHCFLGLHRWVLEKAMLCAEAGVEISVGLLVARANEEGIAGDRLRPELEDLTFQPFQHPERVRELAAIVVEKAEARLLIDQLHPVDMALRTGQRTTAQARRYLARLGCQGMDENDRLLAGVLPTDPKTGTVPVTPRAKAKDARREPKP